MERKKSRARDSVEQAKQPPGRQRRREEAKKAREERGADQFQQIDGAESTYFEKG